MGAFSPTCSKDMILALGVTRDPFDGPKMRRGGGVSCSRDVARHFQPTTHYAESEANMMTWMSCRNRYLFFFSVRVTTNGGFVVKQEFSIRGMDVLLMRKCLDKPGRIRREQFHKPKQISRKT